MTCLYRADYGPDDPGFHVGSGGALVAGVKVDARALASARNQGQLEAAKRVIARGQTVAWCDEGYGWASNPAFETAFLAAVAGVVIACVVLRLRLRRATLRPTSHPSGRQVLPQE
jgi:hypothetical protein